MSRDVFVDQPPAFDGPVVDAANFLKRVQRYLDMAQFRDVAVDLADDRLYILSESRFEDLIVYGHHPLAWLIDISSYPVHTTLHGTTLEDLETLISQWCGSITDQTGRPHIVLDAWMYDQFRQKQPIACAAGPHLAPEVRTAPARPAPIPDTSASIICLETYRATGERRPPRAATARSHLMVTGDPHKFKFQDGDALPDLGKRYKLTCERCGHTGFEARPVYPQAHGAI